MFYKNNKLLLSCLCIVLTPTSYALNEPVEGVYFGGVLGATYMTNLSNITSPNPFTLHLSGKPNMGLTGGFQFGYRFKKNFRVEAEYFGTYDKVHELTVKTTTGTANIPSSSDYTTSDSNIHTPMAFMANIFFDYIIKDGTTYSKHVPYIGVGYGIAKINTYFAFHTNKPNTSTLKSVLLDGSENVNVAQLVIGYSQFLDDYTSVGIDYRLRRYSKVKAFNEGFNKHVIAFTFKSALTGIMG